MKDPSKPTDGKDRLSKLPSELILEVFFNLSPESLCRCRILSTFFKKFMDENESTLLFPIIDHHDRRIAKRHKQLVQIKSLTFPEALQRLLSYHGRISDYKTYCTVMKRFCQHFIESSYPDLSADSRAYLVDSLIAAAECVEWPDDSSFTDQFAAFENLFSTIATAIGIPGLSTMMDDLVDAKLSSEGPRYTERLGVPEFFLTEYETYGLLDRREKPKGIGKLMPPQVLKWERFYPVPPGTPVKAEPKDISAWLELPSIGNKGLFAYCVKSEKMQSLAQEAWKRQGKKLTIFEEAALMESIFIW